LEAIIQGTNKSLQDYLDYFNKEAIQVPKPGDKMKVYLLKRGPWREIEIVKFNMVTEPRDLNDLLVRAKTYIHYI